MKPHDDRKTVVMVVDDAIDSIRMISDALAEWLSHNLEPGHQMPIHALDVQHSVEYLALVDAREYVLRLKTPQNQLLATQ